MRNEGKLEELIRLLGERKGWPWRLGEADIDTAIILDRDGNDVFADDYADESYQDETHAKLVVMALDLLPALIHVAEEARRFHRDVNRTWHKKPVRNLDEANEGLRVALRKLFSDVP